MRLRVLALWASLRSSYWLVPTLMALGAVVLAYGLIVVNDYIPPELSSKLKWLYSGGPEGARSLLSTIAGSVITVAGTTFSITIAALTLASSQFGPRLLRTFRRDTGNQVVLGAFISTFLYCLLVLRTIVGTDKNRYVPDLAITFGVFLAVLSLAVLIYFIHHTAASIQVSNLMDSVAKDLNSTIEANLPEQDRPLVSTSQSDELSRIEAPIENTAAIKTRSGGYLLRIDYEALVRYARKRNCRLFIHLKPGDFSLPDLPLATITPGDAADKDENEQGSLYNHFYFGHERTPEQDPEHAFLELAEIAVRALSPGINDPFTAIAGLDKVTESMALVAKRRIAPRYLCDAENTLRVITVRVEHRELVFAAFQFIRKAATGNREVLAHLSNRLRMLLERTDDPNLSSALEQQLMRADEDIRQCQS